jgi:hypothetical protein
MKAFGYFLLWLSFLCVPALAQQASPSNLPGGLYFTTPPTLTNKQQSIFQVDVNGNLKVVSAGTPSGTQDVNVKQVGGATAAQGHGTAAAALRVELPTDGTGVLGLNAGTAIVGKFGIDQTTPGTTNGVTLTGNSFANITTSTTTTVKSGAGVLHTVCVNTDGTVASAVQMYDNTAASGTKIGNINSLSTTGCYTYDVGFSTGLTLVTTGTVASDITVSYR